jgi:hypothetical protein
VFTNVGTNLDARTDMTHIPVVAEVDPRALLAGVVDVTVEEEVAERLGASRRSPPAEPGEPYGGPGVPTASVGSEA